MKQERRKIFVEFHHDDTNSLSKVSGDCQEARCECGNLLARLRPNGVELKCRRCKRTVVLSIEEQQKG